MGRKNEAKKNKAARKLYKSVSAIQFLKARANQPGESHWTRSLFPFPAVEEDPDSSLGFLLCFTLPLLFSNHSPHCFYPNSYRRCSDLQKMDPRGLFPFFL